MNALVEAQRDKLIDLCREYAVKKLELFGSAAVGDFDLEKSDLDPLRLRLLTHVPLVPSAVISFSAAFHEPLELAY